MERANVWLIAGPTASGKSALALDLARLVGGEIVNADSMQVYRDLRILTARPSQADEAVVPHHLYGVADGDEAWSVGRWLRAVEPVLAGIAGRRRVAVVVGGTGLYLRALTDGLAPVPSVPIEVRAEATTDYDRLGEAAFRAELRLLDPSSESRIASGDRQRLIRASEVMKATGRPLGAWQAETRPTLAPGGWRAVVIEPPRATLYARIDARFAAMIGGGALAEVQALMGRGLAVDLPVMKALGVQALASHLRGETSDARAADSARMDTRRFAKRQSTWFRNQSPYWPRIDSADSLASISPEQDVNQAC